MEKQKKESLDNKILYRNNTSFPLEVTTKLRDLYNNYIRIHEIEGKSSDERWVSVLRYHQYMIRQMFVSPEYGIGARDNARGLLINHTMGMGKTRLAVAIAMSIWDIHQPLVILPKSIQRNFVGEVEKVIKLLFPDANPEIIKKKQIDAINRFKFVAMDAYNMAKQISTASSGIKNGSNIGSLDNKLIIEIGRAHV